MTSSFSQPGNHDAVLGGQSTPSASSDVLGGLKVIKQRLASLTAKHQLEAVLEGLKYGREGQFLIVRALDDPSAQVRQAAYTLLQALIIRALNDSSAQVRQAAYALLQKKPEARMQQFKEQVVRQLQSVPVFMITNAQGVPLVAALEDEDQAPAVARVFINCEDAQASLDNLRQSDPAPATGMQVMPISLAQVYELAVTKKDQEQRLKFTFVPTAKQVKFARSVIQQSGENPDEFKGVPIFLARSTGDKGGYLTIQQGQNQVIPVFFNQDELQNLLARLRESQPELADSMTIRVVNLESLIQTLQDSNNPELNQILLVPLRETLEFIRSTGGQPVQHQ